MCGKGKENAKITKEKARTKNKNEETGKENCGKGKDK